MTRIGSPRLVSNVSASTAFCIHLYERNVQTDALTHRRRSADFCNYRWRLDLAQGEAKYAALESRLAHFPSVTVPTIALEGDANGAPHPQPEAYAKRFTGKCQFRLITGGIGHNLPEEAPQAFTQAVIDAGRL